MKKKLFYTIFLFVILIFFNTKCKATTKDDFTYTVKDNNATITAYSGTASNLTIPSTIDGYNVKEIGTHAFDESRTQTNGSCIVNLKISEGITKIGDFAFVRCANLENIELPESLISLGEQTFLECTKLKKINIPSKIVQLGYSGFMFQGTGFEEFTIPKNVTSISTATFRSCKNLKKFIVYSDNVVYGDNDVFQYCSSDLVLYGNEGSTTQAFAKANNLQFKLISDNSSDNNNNDNSGNDDNTNNTTGNTNTSDNSNQNTIGNTNQSSGNNTSNIVGNTSTPSNTSTNTSATNIKNTTFDNTIKRNGSLPKTGIKFCLIFVIFATLIITFVSYKKYKNIY